MHSETLPEGLRITLKNRSPSRLLLATPLGFWLCGWLVGELFALGALGYIAFALLTGAQLPDGATSSTGGAFAAIGFLLLWLTLWTFGGFHAVRTCLRLIVATDRLLLTPTYLTIEQCASFLTTKRTLQRHQIEGFFLRPSSSGPGILMAETNSGPVQVCTCSSIAEMEFVQHELSSRYLAPSPQEAIGQEPAKLPPNWQSLKSLEGARILLPETPASRRAKAAFTLVLATALLTGAGLLSRMHLVGALILAGLSLLAFWGALRLLFGHVEWRLEAGQISKDWRWNGLTQTRMQGDLVELRIIPDSDGPDSYALILRGCKVTKHGTLGQDAEEKLLENQTDQHVPRRLGLWLARECGVSFIDLPPPRDKAAIAEQAWQNLVQSGKFGSTIAGWLRRK